MVYIIDFLLNLIYPNVCGFCGKIDENSLCSECEEKLNKNLIYEIENIKDKFFEKQIFLGHYDGELKNSILLYKFGDRSYMYKTFSKLILNNGEICNTLKSYDIIGAVPIHKKRKAERGYNQSELIAKEVAKNIKEIKYESILKKVKNNERQSSLNKADRTKNVKNVYEVKNKEIIHGRRIILCDDIYTTGNTVNECSRILKANGAKEVLVLTLAK